MPIHCIGDRRSPVEGEEDEEEGCSIWQEAPDSLLLYIFSYLDAGPLLRVAETCKAWNRVANDESLWRNLMRLKWGIKEHCLLPKHRSWQAEYKRLYYHAPTELSENLTLHNDEVLHVSFSHRGDMFSTTSKDATIKVWNVGYPTTLKYSKDFGELLSWDFTQFSCFNNSDSMLLVSSVKTTDYMDRRGFVAILSLIHDFGILRVVSMDPSQLFGAWLDDTHFLGGYLEISLDRFATTVQIEAFDMSEHVVPQSPDTITVEDGLGSNLFTFCSETASLIKFLTVAKASIPIQTCNIASSSTDSLFPSASQQHALKDVNKTAFSKNVIFEDKISPSTKDKETLLYRNAEVDDKVQKKVEDSNCKIGLDLNKLSSQSCSTSKAGSSHGKLSLDCKDCRQTPEEPSTKAQSNGSNQDMWHDPTENLIFVTGDFAVALHQLGIKNVSPSYLESKKRLRTDDIMDTMMEGEYDHEEQHMVVNFSNNDIQLRHVHKSDRPDHLIDLYGHVTGLCLSQDHRYLYLNCRSWIGNVDRTDPWATPDLSPNIEIRVIDLSTMKDAGLQYSGHKGFSKSTMCCFVFLDISRDYVGSGSEDAKGYLWDRHYCAKLATFDHPWGVVNAVGFNPHNQEYLVTVCDDKVIKIWRSKSEMKKYGIPTPPLLESESSDSDNIFPA